ncbi:hypothetical protein ACFY5D_03605 [Paeniglutamicibacter sp. NPDC012692]|uniref:hypothetical protein n=1 Tax=Paeniglutamicibacter sp. NPDC012692 TaxID=3364388 RepID=UPI0036CB55E5
MTTEEAQIALGIAQIIASLIIGFFGAAIGNSYSKKRDKATLAQARRASLIAYEKALMDLSWAIESSIAEGLGAHPFPDKDDLEKARNEAYPYIFEFENHKQYFTLKSPYFESFGGDDRFEQVDFYSAAQQTIAQHLKDHPNPLTKSPYPKEVK